MWCVRRAISIATKMHVKTTTARSSSSPFLLFFNLPRCRPLPLRVFSIRRRISSSGGRKNPFSEDEKNPDEALRVLFFGGDLFSAPTLMALDQMKARGEISTLQVVTSPDKPDLRRRGKGTKRGGNTEEKKPEKEKEKKSLSSSSSSSSEKKNVASTTASGEDVIPLKRNLLAAYVDEHLPHLGETMIQPPSDAPFRLEECSVEDWHIPPDSFDVGVVVSFGFMLSAADVSAFQHGMINVHPSLLPLYRGAAPIPRALMDGVEETGVSIISVHPEHIDAGQILAQERVSVPAEVTFQSLAPELAQKGADMIVSTLRNLPAKLQEAREQIGCETAAASNDSSGADGGGGGVTLAPKITTDDCRVDWKSDSAQKIFNQWRGLKGIRPLMARLPRPPTSKGKVRPPLSVVLLDMLPPTPASSKFADISPGAVTYDSRQKILRIHCGGGGVVGCTKLTVGPREMVARDFWNGYLRTAEPGVDVCLET